MNFKSLADPLLSSKLTLISADYVSFNSLGIKFVFKGEKNKQKRRELMLVSVYAGNHEALLVSEARFKSLLRKQPFTR